MKKFYHKKWPWQILLVCSLASLLAACGGSVLGATAPSHLTTTPALINQQVPSTTGIQTTTMPPTQTACPPENTARPAIMRPLRLGTAPTAVYIFNEVPLHTTIAYGRLMRSAVGPDQNSEIVNSGLSIQWAQVSADGQWILFLSTPDPRGDHLHSGMLQLVRMDGQGLQTLYCIPNSVTNNTNQQGHYSPNIQWSEDQKSILINTDTNDMTSTITLLNPATGALKTLLHITDPNQLYRYSLLTWLDNSRAYILKLGRQGPSPPLTLYLLNTRTSHDTQGGDLKKVLDSDTRFHNLSFDSSYDGTKLFFSNCFQMAIPFNQTISVGPATGGTFTTLYHQDATSCVSTLRAGAENALLMVGEQTDSQGQNYSNRIWKLNQDGTGWQTLYARPRPTNQYEYFSLNTYTQFPWSDFSRDGNKIAFSLKSGDTGVQQLFYLTINGGQPHTIATTPADETNSSISMVGWTTY